MSVTVPPASRKPWQSDILPCPSSKRVVAKDTDLSRNTFATNVSLGGFTSKRVREDTRISGLGRVAVPGRKRDRNQKPLHLDTPIAPRPAETSA
jgi:hypothetical protein